MESNTHLESGTIFRENLQRYFDANEISHNSVAMKSGVSQKTVWSVATGRSVPTLNTAQNVARAAGVDASILTMKMLSPSQVARSRQMATLMADLIDLTPADFTAVMSHVRALRKPEQGSLIGLA